MDPFSDILRLLSAQSYATAALSVDNKWCRQYSGFDGLKFIFIKKGHFWFRLEKDEEWISLGQGDGVVLTRCQPFIMSIDKQYPVVMASADEPSVNVYCKKSFLPNLLLAGKMEIDAGSAELLLSMLPDVLPFNSQATSSNKISWLMEALYREKTSTPAGYSLACDHLMHLAIIEVFRDWLQSSSAKGISAALVEARILRVLHHIHNRPEKKWTLPELADIANLSRSGFAKKFLDVMGNTPQRYVTEWRMRIASKYLRQKSGTIKSIAFRLGYKNESTFSAVFKRIYGHSPSQHEIIMQKSHANKILKNT